MKTLMLELRAIRAALGRIEDRLNAMPCGAAMPVPGFLTAAEFAKRIRRSPEYVTDRCRIGTIKALPGKPYRIPAEELARFAKGGE